MQSRLRWRAPGCGALLTLAASALAVSVPGTATAAPVAEGSLGTLPPGPVLVGLMILVTALLSAGIALCAVRWWAAPRLAALHEKKNHDLTELRGSQHALRAALAEIESRNAELQRSRAELESFAGVVSHDLKSPLVGVSGYVQLLRHLASVHEQPAEFDEFLVEIIDGVETMRALIDSHLSYATADEGLLDRSDVDLTALVESVLAPHVQFRRHTGEPVPVITVDPLPLVVGDAAMLRQVLENLISNALKYTAPGRAAEIHVTGRRDDAGWAHIEVADRGIGVPAGQHDQIFTSFHRAHRDADYAGTGLGLSICERIVRRHGGEIGCVPNPGGGTRFWLTLPGPDTADPRTSLPLAAEAVH